MAERVRSQLTDDAADIDVVPGAGSELVVGELDQRRSREIGRRWLLLRWTGGAAEQDDRANRRARRCDRARDPRKQRPNDAVDRNRRERASGCLSAIRVHTDEDTRLARRRSASIISRVPDNEVRYELLNPRELVFDDDPREFDRVAFAMRALERLAPKRLTVAVYPSSVALNVQKGRDLRREGDAWAIVGVPPNASRAYIAFALAELAGVESVPYAVQMLLADEDSERGRQSRAAYR